VEIDSMVDLKSPMDSSCLAVFDEARLLKSWVSPEFMSWLILADTRASLWAIVFRVFMGWPARSIPCPSLFERGAKFDSLELLLESPFGVFVVVEENGCPNAFP
jgi:hypothetical protein